MAAAALVLSACSNDEPRSENENTDPDKTESQESPEVNPQDPDFVLNAYEPIPLSSAEKVAINNANSFAWRVFAASQANGTFAKGNEVISPLSLDLCLSLVANATDGNARRCILEALGVANIEDLNSANAKLVDALVTIDNSAKVSFANAVWHRDFVTVKPAFAADLNKWYNAEAQILVPATAQADVNKWCEDKTNGVIKNFPLGDPEQLMAMLLNATYFKGMWANSDKFDKANTAEAPFYGETKADNAPFMSQKLGMRYFTSEHATATQLYFGNEAYSLTLVLPNQGASMEACISDFCDKGVLALKYEPDHMVTVYVPKFKVDGIYDLNASLKDAGLAELFLSADFSNMTDYAGLNFSKVQQVSSFAIDEEGVEAAAVTGGMIDAAAPPTENPVNVEMRFNRPFIYYISERSSDAILFMGRVMEL